MTEEMAVKAHPGEPNTSGDGIAGERRFGRRYSPAEKVDAIEFCKSVGVPEAAKQLGVSEQTLYKWRLAQTGEVAPRRQRPTYTLEQQTEAADLAERIGIAGAAKQLGISRSTLGAWAPRIQTREYRQYTAQERSDALTAAEKFGAAEAARVTGIRYAQILKWVGNDERPRSKRQNHTSEKRLEAMTLAATVGATKAAQQLGISGDTLRAWIRKEKDPAERLVKKQYSADFRKAAITRAREIGVKQAAQELDVTSVSLHQWIRKTIPLEERKKHRTHPEELRLRAITLAKEVGVIQAAVDLGVNESTLSHWVRAASTEVRESRTAIRTYDITLIENVLAEIPNVGLARAATMFDVPYQMARKWAKASGIQQPRAVGLHKSFDKTLGWMQREFPGLEEWRTMGVEWIDAQDTSISDKLTALRRLFLGYVLPNGLQTSPALLFTDSIKSNDFRKTLPDSIYGITIFNAAVDFLDWVLLRYFSTLDEHGRRVVKSGMANPFARQSMSDVPQHTESVYSTLPYGYIDELRALVAPGPNFGDWKWAQSAFGAREALARTQSADWFAVDPSLVDRNDPDCVFRERMRSADAGGMVVEMWSPVRWVALLIKLILPLRTFQVRMLDSGESDTWKYVNKGWTINEHALRDGTESKPVGRGVLRRSISNALQSEHWGQPFGPDTLIYINTNKTADAAKTGSRKGYVFPWPSAGPLHGDPFTWFQKLRAWQEKYNPITRRTKWSELDGRHIKAKSKAALAGFADACFLFRCPEAKAGEQHLPLASGILDTPWRAVLLEFQQRLGRRGESHADGSPIRLVSSTTDAVDFPLHSLRVSLLTALARDGQVPFPILAKVAGHSRLLMAIYYFKPGSDYMRRVMHEGFQRLEANKDSSIVHFLKTSQYDRLVEDVIANDMTSLLASIKRSPADRNPAGWMPLHIGICLVGGNASPSQDKTGVGGCYNGGPNEGSSTSRRHGPVPGGARNCPRCRWLATRPEHLPPLVALFNTIMYHFDEARDACVDSEARLDVLKKARMAAEDADQLFTQAKQLRDAERLFELHTQRFNERAEDGAACVRLITRCQDALRKTAAGLMKDGALLATGSAFEVRLVIEEVDSELLQLSDVCEAAEIYPDLEPGKAVFRRSQLLDAALSREGRPPMLVTLSESEQLMAGNALMRRLAAARDPTDKTRGHLQIISLIDARASLKKHLGIDFFEAALLPSETDREAPISLVNQLQKT